MAASPTLAVGFTETDASRKASAIEGWLSEREGRALYKLAQECPADQAIIEIGSYKGRSTIWLACGALAGNGAKVYAIDPHVGTVGRRQAVGGPTYHALLHNLAVAGVESVVTPILATSESAYSAWRGAIPGVVWADGNHRYPAVSLDLRLWGGALANGGAIACHDTRSWTGPTWAVVRHVALSRHFARIHRVDSLALAHKVERATLGQALANIAFAVGLLWACFKFQARHLDRTFKLLGEG